MAPCALGRKLKAERPQGLRPKDGGSVWGLPHVLPSSGTPTRVPLARTSLQFGPSRIASSAVSVGTSRALHSAHTTFLWGSFAPATALKKVRSSRRYLRGPAPKEARRAAISMRSGAQSWGPGAAHERGAHAVKSASGELLRAPAYAHEPEDLLLLDNALQAALHEPRQVRGEQQLGVGLLRHRQAQQRDAEQLVHHGRLLRA